MGNDRADDAQSRFRDTAVGRRLLRLARDLTMRVFVAGTELWQCVAWEREGRVIPVVGLPPEHYWDDHIEIPPLWLDDLPACYLDLIPPDLRHLGRERTMRAWEDVFTAIIQYHPPPGQLLDYADRLYVRLSREVAALPPTWTVDEREVELNAFPDAALGMPPVVWLFDPEEAVRLYRAYHDALLAALADQLAPLGVDLPALVETMRHEETVAEASRRYFDVRKNPRPYLDAHGATKEDIASAYDLLVRHGHVGEVKATKTPRDLLACIQCAIWYDLDGWSHERIAARFGWTVQHPPGQTPRSETVRQHVAAGRDFFTTWSAHHIKPPA